jgi:hypothetical protein
LDIKLINNRTKLCSKRIEKSQNAIKDLEVATAEAEAATIKNDEAINNAVSELTELIMGILGQLSTNGLVEGTE